ncbi:MULTISPECIES: LysR family transcriptional regulator [Delftia]|uniref:LysR family transcriptional regulator n=1 Tax=Delftia TaxID=80865 RepID=UPI00092B4B17|nr:MULTISPECIES: LysR family transcriptional regulator [Delftia]MDH0419993.1 LysR family transcriptional regulator [Delftia tsuruhatensis]OJX17274.1 MAG: LysR family transcriptional regulator [Delftia sp. 67-8]QFS65660.1 LysR family transcriptional regulator [Delftia tsuruhatensis]WON87233.1 LysR family transcriptional regulator [Delftia sp. UGAL515B_04]
MDLRALRYFIAVLEAGSLSRAAHSLYVAQPALTAQIKKLEGELGAQLLERSHAGVTPTPAGAQLYEDARRLLSDADAMRERIQRLPQGPEGSVTIALPFLLTSLLAGPLIASLRHSHPRIRIFVLDDLSLMVQKAMLDRRADLAILVDTASLHDLQVQPMAEESIYVCGQDGDGSVAPLLRPAPDGGLPHMDFAHACQLPLVLQSRRFSIRQTVEAAADARELRLNIVHEHDSARVIRSLYHCGAGFTFTPACSLSDAPAWLREGAKAAPTGLQPGWIVAQVAAPSLLRRYFLAVQANRGGDPALQVVRQALLDQARQLITAGLWQARWQHPQQM